MSSSTAPQQTQAENNNNNNNGDSAAKRLLTSSYRAFPSPYDIGDRYVTFLLKNDRTRSILQNLVLVDHLSLIRQKESNSSDYLFGDAADTFTNRAVEAVDNNGQTVSNNGNNPVIVKRKKKNASIEIDAFQLISIDPVIGNLTLRYPDTLLELLEDSTIHARKVLHRRMELSMIKNVEQLKEKLQQKQQGEAKQEEDEISNLITLLKAFQYTKTTYNPRPLHARLVHLPPHHQFCKPTLSSITSSDVGTVVQICGTVVKAGPIRMMEVSRTYQCLNKECGYKFIVNADFGTNNNALPMPIVCPSDTTPLGDGYDDEQEPCRSTSFAIVQDESDHCDYQEIKIQESASALTRVGSIPRSILIKLNHDLVDKCNPGDEVVVVGCLLAMWQNQTLGQDVECMVGMCMRAHSVRVINSEEDYGGGSSGTSMADLDLFGKSSALGGAGINLSSSGNLREKFRREFDAFWSDPSARRRPIATRDYIVRAVCPKLYGMHAVKLGMLLVLIGGASISSSSSADAAEDKKDTAGEKEVIEVEEDNDSDEGAPVAFDISGGGDDDDNKVGKKKKRKKKRTNTNTFKKDEVKTRRRIQSHILLIGDPGTGKSQFLRFAAALSPRSVLTTGTGSSTAGLTCAAVRDSGNEFSLEAGALALADRGVCCIDEFGCMSKEDRTSIHEAMEQQTISVAKAGIICKLNARATVVAVMNPNGGIYDEQLSLEQNSRLGSALLSRFDLIFVMLDQAECGRDCNIAHFLLQQSIIPGSGYDRPFEMDNALFSDDNAKGHWSMDKLRQYIATIREKFQPTLTPEASELLENHYALCRQQRNGESLITVRFLESLIRLSQAHARLMYRDKVLLDDAVAVILLMECTPATSSGGMFGSGGCDNGFYDDVFLAKNPIDSEFLPFDQADNQFEKEKRCLLQRYHPNNNNVGTGSGQHGQFNYHDEPSQPNFRHTFETNQQNFTQQNDLRDQWGRQRMSQAISPRQFSLSQNNNSVRHAMSNMGDQYTPQLPPPSGNSIPQSLASSGGDKAIFPPPDVTNNSNIAGPFANGFNLPTPQEIEPAQQKSSGKKRKKKRRTAD